MLSAVCDGRKVARVPTNFFIDRRVEFIFCLPLLATHTTCT